VDLENKHATIEITIVFTLTNKEFPHNLSVRNLLGEVNRIQHMQNAPIVPVLQSTPADVHPTFVLQDLVENLLLHLLIAPLHAHALVQLHLHLLLFGLYLHVVSLLLLWVIVYFHLITLVTLLLGQLLQSAGFPSGRSPPFRVGIGFCVHFFF